MCCFLATFLRKGNGFCKSVTLTLKTVSSVDDLASTILDRQYVDHLKKCKATKNVTF